MNVGDTETATHGDASIDSDGLEDSYNLFGIRYSQEPVSSSRVFSHLQGFAALSARRRAIPSVATGLVTSATPLSPALRCCTAYNFRFDFHGQAFTSSRPDPAAAQIQAQRAKPVQLAMRIRAGQMLAAPAGGRAMRVRRSGQMLATPLKSLGSGCLVTRRRRRLQECYCRLSICSWRCAAAIIRPECVREGA